MFPALKASPGSISKQTVQAILNETWEKVYKDPSVAPGMAVAPRVSPGLPAPSEE